MLRTASMRNRRVTLELTGLGITSGIPTVASDVSLPMRWSECKVFLKTGLVRVVLTKAGLIELTAFGIMPWGTL